MICSDDSFDFNYSSRHLLEHRQELSQQMDCFTRDPNEIQQMLIRE